MPTNNYILTPEGNFISESELYHHGVKGMKWGVRKQKQTSATGRRKNKKDSFVSEFKKDQKRQKRHIATKRAISVGRAAANSYLKRHDVTINGNPVRINSGIEALARLGLNYKYTKDTFK